MIKESVRSELKREFKKIRENKLLIHGILIGIIGSLIAGVITDLVKKTGFYPWIYLSILIIILILLILKLLESYIRWKIYLFEMQRWMKNAKKVCKKYGLNLRDSV